MNKWQSEASLTAARFKNCATSCPPFLEEGLVGAGLQNMVKVFFSGLLVCRKQSILDAVWLIKSGSVPLVGSTATKKPRSLFSWLQL